MLLVRVDHLVGHDRRQLGVCFEKVQNARREEDKAPRQAEGVDGVRGHQADLIGNPALHMGFQPVQYHIQPRDDRRVRGEGPFLLNLGQSFPPNRDFLL